MLYFHLVNHESRDNTVDKSHQLPLNSDQSSHDSVNHPIVSTKPRSIYSRPSSLVSCDVISRFVRYCINFFLEVILSLRALSLRPPYIVLGGGDKRLSIFATSVFGSLHYLHFTLNAPILSTEWHFLLH